MLYMYIASSALAIFVAENCFILAEVDLRVYHICAIHEPGCTLRFFTSLHYNLPYAAVN